MKKNVVKKLAMGMAAIMMVSTLAGCGSDNANNTANNAQKPATETSASANLKGTISLAGSTSMEKLCEAMSESFMESYPDISVTVQYTGSGAGIESLVAGSIDIGNASRNLKDGEKKKAL